MRKASTVLLCLAFLPSLAPASGLNLNGLGSRALAMGGAFVGLADDISALYWNPAGLSRFRTRTLGLYGADIIPRRTYSLEIPSEYGPVFLEAASRTRHYFSGLAAAFQPLGEHIVAGFGVYAPSVQGASWDGKDFAPSAHPFRRSYELMSRVAMVTFAPGLAYTIGDVFSVGAAWNINYAVFDLKRWAGAVDTPAGSLDLGQFETSLSGWGVGATFGVLVEPGDRISVGAALRTASRVVFKGRTSIARLPALGLPGSSESGMTILWPLWLGAGLAVKPLPGLTVTGDLQWTKWSVMDKIALEYSDLLWKSFSSREADALLPLRWQSTLQVRFGLEVRLTPLLVLRAGYYKDPSPGPDRTMNILLPIHDSDGLSFGLGARFGGLDIDLGFECLLGEERNILYSDAVTDPEYADAQPGTYGLKVFVPNISASYRF